ncbi:MAG: HNH endonuclease signature motif containing protein [Acidimicrobiia bacterium]|nr:HNH endonuclease signature motif containing protein [Acidimicrobiia bacterium]
MYRQRDDGRCVQCGSTDGPHHIDHIYPYSKGGPNTLANLQLLCERCNLEKAASIRPGVTRPPDAWDAELARQREQWFVERQEPSEQGDEPHASQAALDLALESAGRDQRRQ